MGLMFVFWYLGGGAVSLMNGVVMLVAFGKWIAWRRKQHDLHTIQKREQEEVSQMSAETLSTSWFHWCPAIATTITKN